MYLFDKLIDERAGQNVSLTVLRRKEAIDVELPVLNLQGQKPRNSSCSAAGLSKILRRNELDGREIRNLDEFINAARTIAHGTNMTVIYQDLLSIDTAPKAMYVSFDLMVSDLRTFRFNDHAGNWEETQWHETSRKNRK